VIHSYNKNPRDALMFQIYSWNRTVQVSVRFSLHHRESSTVYTAKGICHTGNAYCLLAGSILISLASSKHNMYDIYLLLYTSIQY